jgi:hypothetical protein
MKYKNFLKWYWLLDSLLFLTTWFQLLIIYGAKWCRDMMVIVIRYEVWKEGNLTYFKMLSGHWLGTMRKLQRICRSWILCRDMNAVLREYKSLTLLREPVRKLTLLSSRKPQYSFNYRFAKSMLIRVQIVESSIEANKFTRQFVLKSI